jgi:hypothetical protein
MHADSSLQHCVVHSVSHLYAFWIETTLGRWLFLAAAYGKSRALSQHFIEASPTKRKLYVASTDRCWFCTLILGYVSVLTSYRFKQKYHLSIFENPIRATSSHLANVQSARIGAQHAPSKTPPPPSLSSGNKRTKR